MRFQVCALICLLLLAWQPVQGAGREQKRRIVPPKECRTTKYSCILKKVDGVPFFCVRTTKQRYQNARKSMRVVSQRQCLRRYPVEYETVEQSPENEE
jgi:hypothetical protein